MRLAVRYLRAGEGPAGLTLESLALLHYWLAPGHLEYYASTQMLTADCGSFLPKPYYSLISGINNLIWGHKKKKKTYNSRDSLVVTHPTTNLPACGLSTAERTGSPVLHTLWSYVFDLELKEAILAHAYIISAINRLLSLGYYIAVRYVLWKRIASAKSLRRHPYFDSQIWFVNLSSHSRNWLD
jgi:hypothetical protein